MAGDDVLLKVTGLTKRFPGVLALGGVDLEVRASEVHGLCGENGAGKSTLIKMLTGSLTPDAGTIRFDGTSHHGLTPRKAMSLGIACIYQELVLIPHLSVTENIFLGREIHTEGPVRLLDRRRMREVAVDLLADLDLTIDPNARLGSLGVGHQQMVEICRAVRADARLIIMDEPTSSLSEKEARDLFRIIARVKARGVSVIFISHRLDEVRDICDRVTVMRDGVTVARLETTDGSIDEIIRLMVGRDIGDKYPKETVSLGEVILEVKGLGRRDVFHDVSFSLRAGEILGFAGLVGAGRTETARAVTGADPFDTGSIRVFGKEARIRHPQDAIDAGIAFLTEDRKEQGLVLIQSVAFNATLVGLEKYGRFGVLSLARVRDVARRVAAELRLKTASIDTAVGKLSGGNQQKVVIAKWLLSKARIFIFDEPTRGIDVGAKVEVYRLIARLVAEGAGVVVICSEMEEVMGLADRILVMHEGRVTAEFGREEVTREKIMYAASGMWIAS